jgi:hypothetical protein
VARRRQAALAPGPGMAEGGPWLPGHVHGRSSGGRASGGCCRRCSSGGGGRRRDAGDAARTEEGYGAVGLSGGSLEAEDSSMTVNYFCQ